MLRDTLPSRWIARSLGAALVVIAFGLPLFAELGSTDFAGDEPIYAFAIDRMLDQGDWLTPRSIPNDAAPFLEKPPLKFWLVAASVRAGLLPRNEFGYRALDAIFGIAAFLYLFAIGARVGGIVCGLTAGLVLFGHQPLLLVHGLRSNNMEAALVLSYCGGMFHALAWYDTRTGNRRWVHALLVGVWFAFGFMMKFVAAAFLPAIVAAMAALSPRWRRRLFEDWAKWTAACTVSAAVILPWFVYQSALRGTEFWRVILGQHIVVRFTAFLDPSHLHPWDFYLTSIARELSGERDLILVCAGLVLLVYRAVHDRSEAAALMLLWFALPLVALSAGTSKLYHYVYPFLPPLAVGAGLVPMTVLDAAIARREALAGTLERVWRQSGAARMPRWLRRVLMVVAVFAIALAVVTPIVGSVSIHVSGTTIVRSSTIARPLVVAIALMIVLGLFRTAPVAFVVVMLIALLPFDAYRSAKAAEVQRANYDRAPLRSLRDCLLRVQAAGAPKGVFVHTPAEASQWAYVYYLREAGWRIDEAADDERLTERLLDPSGRRPVFMNGSTFERFRESVASDRSRQEDLQRLDGIRSVVWQDGWMMLLPGPYGACAEVKGGSVRTAAAAKNGARR